MPPEYYSSKAEFFPMIDGRKAGTPVLEISYEDHWKYIASDPDESAGFKKIRKSGKD